MKSTRLIQRILDGIRQSETICIVGHVRPDGDCIGSQVGLGMALQAAGKKVVCWNDDPLPKKLGFLDPQNLMCQPVPGREFDCVIATDCASFERLGKTGEHIQQRKLFINIDHHQSNTRYADLNWVSWRQPSTGELIYRLLRVAGWPITPSVADCLFTAVSTDTGSFQYPSTRPSTYTVAGHLVERGADLARICNEVYQSYPLSRVRLVQTMLNRFRLAHDNRTAYFWLRKRDYLRTGAEPDDSEGLIDYIRAIEPVVVACIFEEMEPGLTRISLRSKSDQVNVSDIASQFGGGGHQAAAGARITGNPISVQRKVLTAIRKALNSQQ
jgi:phosphoesterase RecJ-like protein